MPISSLSHGELLAGTYVAVFLVAAVSCGAGVWCARQSREPAIRWGLGSLCAISGLWALVQIGTLVGPTQDVRVACYLAGLVLGLAAVGAWLYFCSAYAGWELHRTRTVWGSALALFGIVAGTKLTNPIHELYVSVAWTEVPFGHLQVDPHPLYWTTVGLSYVLSVAGGALLVGTLRRVHGNTGPLLGLTGLAVLPVALNGIGHASPFLLNVGHEPLGVAAFAAGALFVWGRSFRRVHRLADEDRPALVVGPEGHLRGFNREAGQIFPALRVEQARGRPVSDVVPDLARVVAEDGADILEHEPPPEPSASGASRRSTGPMENPPTRYYQVTEVPSPPDRLLLLSDVTVRELRRQARRDEHRFLSATVEQIGEPVLITEAAPLEPPGPRIVYVNEAFEALTGYTEAELIGKTPRILQGPETDPATLADLRRALEAGTGWAGQTINYRKDGTKYVVQWDVTPVRGQDGSIDYWASVHRDVTEEQRRKRMIRRSRERYQSLFEDANDAILVHNLQGRIREANPRAAALFRCEADALVDQTVGDLHPPDEKEHARTHLRALREGESIRTVARYQRMDGSTFWGEMSATVTDIAGTTVARTLIRDVSDWIEAERRLERQNDLFVKAQEIAEVGAWEYDLRSGESTLTDQIFRIHGRSTDEELSPEESLRFYHPEDRTEIRDAFRRAIEEGESYDLELRFEPEGGGQRWVRTSGEPQTEGEGADEEVVRVRGTLQDITDRKRRERALEDRQNKVEALYEATEHLLRAEREEEVARYLVTLVGRTLGYPGTTIRFARNGQLLPSKVSSMVRHHMPERPVYDIDGTSPAARAYRKGETLFYEDLSAEQDTLDRGEIRATAYVPMGSHGLISVGSLEVGGIDAFDRHLIEVLAAYASVVLNRLDREEALREAKDEAEEADRMKSVFLANLSHEIRTPLTSIIGFAEAIGDEMAHLDSPSSPDDEDALNLSALSRFAGLIRESGERLLGTLDGVLNLSKLEAGEMGLVAEPVDVAATVRAIAQEFEPQAEAAGVELTADPPDGAIWVRGDEEGIEMILRNLVSNALKYTEEGGRVWVRAREATEQDEAVLIEVEDTGVGIDEDDIDTLFEPFRQASEGMGRRYEGTGLGLTITRKATREMEGSIEVETEKGEGSRFVVRLPGADAADGSSGSSAQAA